jgi:predicted PurR-regulated permease PerM
MASALQERPEETRDPPAPVQLPTRDRWSHRALAVIAGVLLVGALKFAQAAFVPVLFAAFIALLLSPAVEWLERRRMPRILAAVLVMVTLVAFVAGCVSLTWQPAREWLDTAPATLRKLETKLRPVIRFVSKVESVSDQAAKVAEPVSKSNDQPTPVALQAKGWVQSTQEWVIALVSMLFLTLFMLGTDLAAVARRIAPDSAESAAVGVFERVRGDLGRYFSAVTLSNLCLGAGTTIAMYLLGMPNPLLWGVTAFTLNFIPYAGSATTLTLLTIVALVSFDGVGKAVSVAGTYLVLTTLEGQVLQPVLVGRRLDVTPPVVLLGLWFGGWLWGVAGIALAMPLLVSVKAALQEIARSRDLKRAAESPETVRMRAAAWLQQNAERYRRVARPPRSR